MPWSGCCGPATMGFLEAHLLRDRFVQFSQFIQQPGNLAVCFQQLLASKKPHGALGCTGDAFGFSIFPLMDRLLTNTQQLSQSLLGQTHLNPQETKLLAGQHTRFMNQLSSNHTVQPCRIFHGYGYLPSILNFSVPVFQVHVIKTRPSIMVHSFTPSNSRLDGVKL